jgi:hypothetical protein
MYRIKEVLEEKAIKQNRQLPRLEVLHEIAKIFNLDVVELIASSKNK